VEVPVKQRLSVIRTQFNWRATLIRWLVYALVLLLVALVVPQIYFTSRRVWVVLLVAAGFGVLNALVRPILQALMLQLLFASMGLVLAIINGFILFLVSLIFPNSFQVSGILAALLGGLLVALFGGFLEGLFGLTLPIVPESEETLRQRLKSQDRSLVYTLLKARPVELADEDQQPLVAGPAPGALPGQAAPSAPAEAVEAAPPDEEETSARVSNRDEEAGA
jgi:putative membrane protein